MRGKTVKSTDWRFAPKGVWVCPSRTMDIGLEPDPEKDRLFGVEVVEAIGPETAGRIAAALNAILDGQAATISPNEGFLRLARFTVWDSFWVVATNEQCQSTIITSRPTVMDAKELVARLNAALEG